MKVPILCAALVACASSAPPAPPPPQQQQPAPEPSTSTSTSTNPHTRAAIAALNADRLNHTRRVGTIPRSHVQQVVRANLPTVKACYARALRRDPTIQGRFTARFIIAETGDVETAAPDPNTTTLTDPELVGCITGVFKSLRFLQPDNGYVIVVYPLVLGEGGVTPAPPPE